MVHRSLATIFVLLAAAPVSAAFRLRLPAGPSLRAPSLSVTLKTPTAHSAVLPSLSSVVPILNPVRAIVPVVEAAAPAASMKRAAPAAVSSLRLVGGALVKKPRMAAPTLDHFWTGGIVQPVTAHGAWSLEEEEARFAEAEAYAHVERHERREEVQHAYAERELLDYARSRYSEELALEFAEEEYEVADGVIWSGLDVLRFVTTPFAVDLNVPLDAESNDLRMFGWSDTDLHGAASEAGVGIHPIQRILERAFRFGLVYRLNDSKAGRTYTGVPYHVRELLGLAAPEVEAAAESSAESAGPSETGASVLELAGRAMALPEKDELFEFLAQTVFAGLSSGLITDDEFPQGFSSRAAALDIDRSSLNSAVLIFLESAHGTEWFSAVRRLAVRGASEGFVDAGELKDVLAALS